MRIGEILRRGVFFALIISVVFSFIAIPAFSGLSFHLEGYDKLTARWERGLLEGWRELDWVPYRIKFADLPGGTSNFNLNVYHNNLYAGKLGIDNLENFRVGDENGNPVNGSVTASGPFYITPGKNSDRDIYYSLSVTFNTPSPGLSWYVYWDAHLAIGSSRWPGARLHAYSDITGNQDVPIRVAIYGVQVSISPSYQSGLSGTTLVYIVTVSNTGNIIDNYDLTVSDELGWGPIVSPTTLEVPALENRTATLSVTIPENALGCTQDNITVVATSQNDNTVSDSDSSIAHVTIVVLGVNVSISPSYQSGFNGENLTYTVTVTNTGNVSDNYDLTVSDELGWGPIVSPTTFEVPAGENRTATLSVIVSENASGCTLDNITVVATSQADNTVSDSDSCIAHVTIIVRGVDISISPETQSGIPPVTLHYIVTVTNTGNVWDNYVLTLDNTQPWVHSLDNGWLYVPPGENRVTTLHVSIPAEVPFCTWGYVTVTGTSSGDPLVKDNAVAGAHSILIRAVDVSISPDYQSGLNGETLTYTVTITNTGNAPDTYDLVASDNSGWSPSVSPPSITLAPGASDNATLSVTIPENALGCTQDNITVAATSQADNTVSDSASCIAHATIVRGVGVTISPDYQSGLNGETLTYTVTISNTGNVEDTYSLAVSDSAGWTPAVSPGSLTVPPWENRTATLSVTVPSNAIGCTIDNITVTATGTGVSDSDSCIAHATIVRAIEISISPIRYRALSGATLPYIVTIRNAGNVDDNYDLAVGDNLGWGPVLSENSISVPVFENRSVTLTVTIPENVNPCTEDNIIVTATSRSDITVTATETSIAHRTAPKLEFVTKFKIQVEIDLYLHTGSKIILAFYTFDNVYENENVIWSGTTPTWINFLENVGHPENKSIRSVRLFLDDNEGNRISTLSAFIVRRDDLWRRLMQIRAEWPYASPEGRDALWKEILDIRTQWPYALP